MIRARRFLSWWQRSFDGTGGYSFVELVVATFVMMILASAALPLVRVSIRRQREMELRKDLWDMRKAIDAFNNDAMAGRLSPTETNGVSCGGLQNFYPSSLDQLVQGVSFMNDTTGTKKKYLRRIPIDPITGSTDWGMRACQDKPDSMVWGGQNVYDVYTKAEGKALDGTKYRDW